MSATTPRMGEVELAGILAEADSTVPYYVPHLVAEIRHLRRQMMRVQNRLDGPTLPAEIADALAIIDAALEAR
jgi:hypothetical protein